MSAVSRVFVIFAFIQVAVNLISGNIEINCPNTPTNPISTTPRLYNTSLSPSCFAIDMRLNVENILPDPSYILPDTNIEIIQNALRKLLTETNHELNIEPMDEVWSIDNQCPQKTDHTVHKSFLKTAPYDILCDESTFKVYDDYMECEFTTPTSIAYTWRVESISTMFTITGVNITMEALIMDLLDEIITAESDIKVMDKENNAAKQEFVFTAPQNGILKQDTTYLLHIKAFEGINVELHYIPSAVSLPVVSTIAEPSACVLAGNLAKSDDMLFAVSALCNTDNADPERRHALEDVLYQSRSSQIVIPSLPPAQRRLLPSLKKKPEARDTPCTSRRCRATPAPTQAPHTQVGRSNSLHAVSTEAKDTEIANDFIFPHYRQCIAIDPETNRVYSVGGDVNGFAIDRLAIHQIINANNAQLIGSLVLDKARSNAMCYYFKNSIDNTEYIIAVNGMNLFNDDNMDNWFGDIVFIPIDNHNHIYNSGSIKLKHNVIDMRAIISSTNELYLFGGRDSDNASSYIQSIDLNNVFSADLLSTQVRMEPMISSLVIPFVDYVSIGDKSCIMIFGGQKFVNKEWIDTEIPSADLQLICNDNIGYFEAIHGFTLFDEEHIQSVKSFIDYVDSNHLFITDYDFKNNDIWYEFNAAFKVCGDNLNNDEYLAQILNVFDTESVTQHVLSESAAVFRAWNDGFSKLNISHINFIRRASSIDPLNHCIDLSQSVCNALVIKGNGGDQECGYNELDNDCYSIQRSHNAINKDNFNDYRQPTIFDVMPSFEKLYITIIILSAVIFVLIFIVTALCWINHRQKSALRLRKVVSVEMDHIHDDTVNTNTNNDDICCEDNDGDDHQMLCQ